MAESRQETTKAGRNSLPFRRHNGKNELLFNFEQLIRGSLARHQLALLARKPKARVTTFTRKHPTDWRPHQVRNPNSPFYINFTKTAAWELIAIRIEQGHPVETVTLRKPEGASGYVMKIDLEPEWPPLYVKPQLGSGKIIGRSFHYSLSYRKIEEISQ